MLKCSKTHYFLHN